MNTGFYSRVSVAVLSALFLSCGLQDDQSHLLILPLTFDFTESEYGWTHGFADYPANPDDAALFQLRYAYTNQPAASKLTKPSVMLSGYNLSNDLFMYMKKRITGLRPNTDYTITFQVELASDLNTSLSESSKSVYLKAGAIHSEPKSVIEADYYVMNIDKGNEATAGEDMMSLGDIASPENVTGYTLFTRTNSMAQSRYVAKSNSNGELWLIVGTDASCAGKTTVFYKRIIVVFTAS